METRSRTRARALNSANALEREAEKEEFVDCVLSRKEGDTDHEIVFAADYFLELLDGNRDLWKEATVPRDFWTNAWCDLGDCCCMEWYGGDCDCQTRETVTCHMFSRFVLCDCCWENEMSCLSGWLTEGAYRSSAHGPYHKYTYLNLDDLDHPALERVHRYVLQNIEDLAHHPLEVIEQERAYLAMVVARLQAPDEHV